MPNANELKRYLADLESPDLADDKKFNGLLTRGISLLKITEREIAHSFGVSRETVKRWKDGKNAPHPAMRAVVYEWLESLASRLEDSQKSE